MPKTLKTQVGIVGAGPAGLLLGHLLHLQGIDSVIIERRTFEYVIDRIRAGVLEQGTVNLMIEAGVGDRLRRESMRHEGIYLGFEGMRHRIDMAEATHGRAIYVYGQNEVLKDLNAARVATGRPLVYGVENVSISGYRSTAPSIRFDMNGEPHEILCDYIAGCDGFHGICRQSLAADELCIYERAYPYAWLGVIADAPPSCDELVYSSHDRGFALFSMRSHSISRLCMQCSPEEDITQWPDDRIWEELILRLQSSDGWKPNTGKILQKNVTQMRSFVAEPMRHGRLFLAGDAAHIVPPTGAKGLNLAASDVRNLSIALAEFYKTGREELLDGYSAKSLRRVWKAQRFSWWMTSMMHVDPAGNAFDRRRQIAELDYVTGSRAAMASLAENYTGTSLD